MYGCRVSIHRTFKSDEAITVNTNSCLKVPLLLTFRLFFQQQLLKLGSCNVMSKFPSLFLFRSKSTIFLFSHDSSPVWVLTKRALDFVVLQEIHRAQQTSLIKPLSSASAAHARDRELVLQRDAGDVSRTPFLLSSKD